MNITARTRKMVDKKYVYIQGVPGKGDEVIKTLEDLGGINSNNLSGDDDASYYYINSQNIITRTDVFTGD